MKSAYEYNKEKLRKAVPSMSFVNGDLVAWKTSAREKLTELLTENGYRERMSLDSGLVIWNR